MVNYCVVPNCNVRGGFQFPKAKALAKKWSKAIRRLGVKNKLWMPSKSSVVCRRHFKDHDFKEKSISGLSLTKLLLKEGAIPSLFLNSHSKTSASNSEPSLDTAKLNVQSQEIGCDNFVFNKAGKIFKFK